MKKKLLFSLLLGSAFAWMNEMYAADTAAAPAAEEAKPAGDAKEEEKKYKAVGLDNKEIEVQFFDKSKHPDFVLKKLTQYLFQTISIRQHIYNINQQIITFVKSNTTKIFGFANARCFHV